MVAPFDTALVRAAHPGDSLLMDRWLTAWHGPVSVAFLVAPLVIGIALLALGGSVRATALGLFATSMPVVTALVVGQLKAWAGRPRPQATGQFDDLHWLVVARDHTSMPSGHVAGAMAAALVLFAFLRRRRGAWLVAPLCVAPMAHGRVALGVHHPSDTLVGVAVALLVGASVWWVSWRLAPRVPVKGRWFLLLTLALLGGALTGSEPVARDPASSAVVDGVWWEASPARLWMEPFLGPPLQWLRCGRPTELAYSAIGWALLVGGVLVVRRRLTGQPGRIFVWAALLLIWAGLAATGRVVEDRFETIEGLILDPHVHADDPVDGAAPVAAAQTSAKRRGVDMIGWTNHDALSPHMSSGLIGTEWSGGRHGEETFLHLLLLGATPAIERLLEVEVPPLEPHTVDRSRSAVQRVIRLARELDCIVVVAHWPRTKRGMVRDGTVAHLPIPTELADWGVDGFEVVNRHPEGRPADRTWMEEIDAVCLERGLLRFGSSDDHGWPKGSPAATFLPGWFPDDALARREAVMERLRTRDRVVPFVMRANRTGPAVAPVFLAPVQALRYVAEMPLGGRLSWLAWASLILLATRLRTPRPSSPS